MGGWPNECVGLAGRFVVRLIGGADRRALMEQDPWHDLGSRNLSRMLRWSHRNLAADCVESLRSMPEFAGWEGVSFSSQFLRDAPPGPALRFGWPWSAAMVPFVLETDGRERMLWRSIEVDPLAGGIVFPGRLGNPLALGTGCYVSVEGGVVRSREIRYEVEPVIARLREIGEVSPTLLALMEPRKRRRCWPF